MRTFVDAKAMAKTLRQSLQQRDIDLSHSDCLELVAQQFGLANWNVLSASIDAVQKEKLSLKFPEGWLAHTTTDPEFYRYGLDPQNENTLLIECTFNRTAGVELSGIRQAALFQHVSAESFRRKRLRFAVQLKSIDVDRGALFLRIFDQSNRELRWEQMNLNDDLKVSNGLKPLVGKHDWTLKEIIMDVPGDAALIRFGIFLEGFGQLRARDIEFGRAGWGVKANTDGNPVGVDPKNLQLH